MFMRHTCLLTQAHGRLSVSDMNVAWLDLPRLQVKAFDVWGKKNREAVVYLPILGLLAKTQVHSFLSLTLCFLVLFFLADIKHVFNDITFI